MPYVQWSSEAREFEQRRTLLNGNLHKRTERRGEMCLPLADLVLTLQELHSFSVDSEKAHYLADELLLAYIAEPAVTDAFGELDKWYS